MKHYSTDPEQGPFRIEVIADSTGNWCGNGLTFDAHEEAEEYAQDLAWRWTAVREWRVVEPEGL